LPEAKQSTAIFDEIRQDFTDRRVKHPERELRGNIKMMNRLIYSEFEYSLIFIKEFVDLEQFKK
jgi:hypothetical protein